MKLEQALSICGFHRTFPDEASAIASFESVRWPSGRVCAHCGSPKTSEVKSRKPAPYRCKTCRKHFSCKVGTVMQSSKLEVRQWLYAMYLMSVSKTGLSSSQLARELGIAQEAAWRLGHKIREAWNQGAPFPKAGTAKVDETYVGGKGKSKHESKRQHLGSEPAGKAPVVGTRPRTGEVRDAPVSHVYRKDPHWMIERNVEPRSTVHADDAVAHQEMRDYRRERYVDEFPWRFNYRKVNSLTMLATTTDNMIRHRLTHQTLADGEPA